MTCPCGNPRCTGPLDHVDTARKIEEYGWAALGIMAEVPFAYTIGLTKKEMPEMIVLGLPLQVAHGFFVAVAPRILSGEIMHGSVVTDLTSGGYRTAFVQAPIRRANDEYLIQANAFFGSDVKALQMVWTDKGNRFPWEDGYAKSLAGVQDGIMPLNVNPFGEGATNVLPFRRGSVSP